MKKKGLSQNRERINFFYYVELILYARHFLYLDSDKLKDKIIQLGNYFENTLQRGQAIRTQDS